MARQLWFKTTVRLFLMAALLAGCASTIAPATQTASDSAAASPVTLNVFAAASLTQAFTEIGAAFDAAHPGVTTVFNFAGSNQLATQIVEGAPADLFASANAAQMNVAIASSRILTGTQQTFARNRLVIIAPTDNPGGLATVADLALPDLKLIFAAPAVPVGQYSLDFLDKAAAEPAYGEAFRQAALANIVSHEENVRAVLAKITLGEADAGIVYTSDLAGAEDKVLQIEIPDALNTIAIYPIAALADSANAELAQAFIDAVLSPEGQAILANHGFLPAAE